MSPKNVLLALLAISLTAGFWLLTRTEFSSDANEGPRPELRAAEGLSPSLDPVPATNLAGGREAEPSRVALARPPGEEPVPARFAGRQPMRLNLQAVTSANEPLPNLRFELVAGGPEAVQTTDFFGRCSWLVTPDPGADLRVRRRLPFAKDRVFDLAKTPREGDLRFASQDDVGYYEFHFTNANGEEVRGGAEASLVSGSGAATFATVRNWHRYPVALRPGKLQLTGEITESWYAQVGQRFEQPLDDPGWVTSPTPVTMELDQAEFRLSGRLASAPVDSEVLLTLRSGDRTATRLLEVEEGGGFVHSFPANVDFPNLEGLQLSWTGLGVDQRFQKRYAFSPPIEAGEHDLGWVEAELLPLLVSGRVVNEQGAPIGGLLPLVTSAAKLVEPERSSRAGWSAVYDGWVATRGPDEGEFLLFGTVPFADPVLWIETSKYFVSIAPVAFSPGDSEVAVRVGARTRGALSFSVPGRNQEARVRIEIWRVGAFSAPSWSRWAQAGKVDFVLAPGDYELLIFHPESGEELRRIPAEVPAVGPFSRSWDADRPLIPEWNDLVVDL